MPADMPVMAELAADRAVAENLCNAITLAGGNALAITDRTDNQIVGCAGYGPTQDRPGTVEAGLWIGAAWWGRGYGTEAAQALIDRALADGRVSALWCSNRVTNSRARRVIEKCGFQFRGTGMVRSPTFFGAFPVERFVLDRRNWASLKAWGAPEADLGRVERETAA
jgi:RimJ/RimL family protein N-acetyltransferase